jgi:hypothetical protein
MYDLLMRPNQGKLPDAARDAARNFRGQVSGDDLAEICEWYGRANDAVKKWSATSGMDSFVPERTIPRAFALGGGFDGAQVAFGEHATLSRGSSPTCQASGIGRVRSHISASSRRRQSTQRTS